VDGHPHQTLEVGRLSGFRLGDPNAPLVGESWGVHCVHLPLEWLEHALQSGCRDEFDVFLCNIALVADFDFGDTIVQ
jgi:hypothetical protein